MVVFPRKPTLIPGLRTPVIAAFLISFIFTLTSAGQDRDVGRLYTENCSACHGANMEGGQTESLLDDTWKYGGDDATIARLIRDGAEQEGMPGWKGFLTEAEIRAMVVLIREKAAHSKTAQAGYPKPSLDSRVATKEHAFKVRKIVSGLSTPWSLAFLSGGRLLVTELSGNLRVVENGVVSPPVAETPRVRARGQGGMMEVALHPGYQTNGWIYLAFSDPAGNPAEPDSSMTAVVRGRIQQNRWSDEQTIFRAPQALYRPGGVHFGSRLVFDEAGHLFFAIGDRGHMQDAQDLSRPNGKVHRLMEDGRIPADNPFVTTQNAMPSIWSFGHRNPQGLAFHPATRDLWSAEHGPRGGDELNLVRPGFNYGWPIVTYGMNYDGRPISAITARPGLEQPVVHWTPSIAVCGINFYTGQQFPAWKNNLLVTGLASEELRRVVINEGKVTEQETLFKGIGRVRHVATGPDGFVYIVLNKPDSILRLEPAGT